MSGPRNADEATSPAQTQPPSSIPGLVSRAAHRRTSRTSYSSTGQSREDSQDGSSYNIPDSYANLDEIADPSPIQNPDEGHLYQHVSLEETRSQEQRYDRDKRREAFTPGRPSPKRSDEGPKEERPRRLRKASEAVTQLYTISYLVLFAIWGTLARLGLQGLTFYPGAPVTFGLLWANFAGSLFMGFLSQDRMLFREEWGNPSTGQYKLKQSKSRTLDEEKDSADFAASGDPVVAKKAHLATKKTIPLYIGLTTGFCGSFTSFSSFIRDAFFALSNDLPAPLSHPNDYNPITSTTSTIPRNGGYSFMAVVAIVIVTITVCISGLHIGAHLAILTEPYTPSLPYPLLRKVVDRVTVILAWGSWLGAVLLAIWPPDRDSGHADIWRGRAIFAIVFAPLGCLARFCTSIYLNGKCPSFPLGTFLVNVVGTAILGMCWDLQHVPLGGVVGCQVLQGVEDGFCGCLTTVSTWVSELSTLRRSHAYKYGAASVGMGLGLLVVIMGSLRWTRGFSEVLCVH